MQVGASCASSDAPDAGGRTSCVVELFLRGVSVALFFFNFNNFGAEFGTLGEPS